MKRVHPRYASGHPQTFVWTYTSGESTTPSPPLVAVVVPVPPDTADRYITKRRLNFLHCQIFVYGLMRATNSTRIVKPRSVQFGQSVEKTRHVHLSSRLELVGQREVIGEI